MADTQIKDELTKTANGNPVLRSNLSPSPFIGCDDELIIVDPETCTVLCHGIQLSWGMIFYPMIFTPEQARRWIAEGTIGQLQEGLSNLNVGFTSVLVKPPRWKTDSSDPALRDGPFG